MTCAMAHNFGTGELMQINDISSYAWEVAPCDCLRVCPAQHDAYQNHQRSITPQSYAWQS
jgi:hypothetical protein